MFCLLTHSTYHKQAICRAGSRCAQQRATIMKIVDYLREPEHPLIAAGRQAGRIRGDSPGKLGK